MRDAGPSLLVLTLWIQAGTLEFDFLSTALAHEAHYKLDLASASDNAIAYKLLERVFEVRATAACTVLPFYF